MQNDARGPHTPSAKTLAESKEQAQRRVDQINAFTRELEQLERAGILALPDDVRQAIGAFHGAILDRLARHFDVDRTDAQKRMSVGMRIASFIGALALSIAVVLFFYRFWGRLDTAVQIGMLVAAPLAALAGVEIIARRERTRYFTGLMAVVAFACFVLDTSVVDYVFGRVIAPGELLAWAALALALAYGYRLRILLAGGVALLIGFVAALLAQWSGTFWGAFAFRPETVMLASIPALAVAALHGHPRDRSFQATWRLFGAIGVLFPIIMLAVRGELSLLTAMGLPARTVQVGYDIAGFGLAIAGIWLSIRRQWREIVNTASTFFVVFLYTKLFDWYWTWMPRYLFFLILGLVAVALLAALKQVRTRLQQV